MAAFTLAHLSDPHLPPLPATGLRDLAGNRALGYLNWTRNRHKFHRRDVLDTLVSDLQALAPDHIAVTGDLVNLALEAEFAPSLIWLESVGTPDRVSVIPGNHDAYVRVTQHRFAEAWRDYLTGDATDGGMPFPFVRHRGPLAPVKIALTLGIEMVVGERVPAAKRRMIIPDAGHITVVGINTLLGDRRWLPMALVSLVLRE